MKKDYEKLYYAALKISKLQITGSLLCINRKGRDCRNSAVQQKRLDICAENLLQFGTK